MDTTPNLPIGTEEQNLKLASELASVNLLFAQQELGRRIVDPAVPTKTLLDIADHSYRVSGMQKKQEVKEAGGKFVFNILMGEQTLTIEKVVEGDTLDADTPATLAQSASSLVLDFEAAPTF